MSFCGKSCIFSKCTKADTRKCYCSRHCYQIPESVIVPDIVISEKNEGRILFTTLCNLLLIFSPYFPFTGGGLPLQQPSQIIVWWHSASDVAQLGLHVQCILATAATVGSAVYNVWTTTFLQQFITTPSSVVGQPALSRAHLALRAVAVTLFSSCPAPCVSLVYSTVSMATKFATESLTSTQYSLWGKAMCP
ncbi:hypothetical protein DPMN_003654 [Dreissena polymorpha]|uniref:Uncharacterized protein n=1 Tax=Dreissena polymorpha TaxID=45954 RepID=A0A9D4RUZ4_DREPO|nr:hypothetical protein DPMN_003654 [Dreissena polymorpha]